MNTPETLTPPHTWAGDVRTFPKMKILIVDDEPLNVALLEDMLTEAGYKHLRSVTDSRLALETCDSFAPDLILLDLMMPHVDGFAILHSIRSAGSEVFLPVIVLTADANEETKRNALAAGATDFLLKPLDQLEVLLRIANLLEMRRLHTQLDTQRAALEDALREKSLELREATSHLESALG
jgi:putative two-component system response regulator